MDEGQETMCEEDEGVVGGAQTKKWLSWALVLLVGHLAACSLMQLRREERHKIDHLRAGVVGGEALLCMFVVQNLCVCVCVCVCVGAGAPS